MVVISPQVQFWAEEIMLLGAMFLTPKDSPEKNLQLLICGIAQTGDTSRKHEKMEKKNHRDTARFGSKQVPPSPGFLLKVATITSTWLTSQTISSHPEWWQQPAGHFLYLCTAPRFVKLLQTPEKMCEACSACMEKLMLPQGREGT